MSPLAAADVLWMPHFDILPSAPVTFLGGYELRTADLLYGESGAWSGFPACDGTWTGPVERYTISPRRQVTIGFDTLQGFAAVEDGDGTRVTHREWRCVGAAFARDTTCGDETRRMAEIPAFAAAPIPDPREIGSGWTAAGAPQDGRAAFYEVGTTMPYDLRATSLRGMEEWGVVPFTGRVFWRVDSPELDGVRSDNYLLGRSLCNGASRIGAEPLPQFDASSSTQIDVGATTTSGRNPVGSVPLPPLGPVGDWRVIMQLCNVECGGEVP